MTKDKELLLKYLCMALPYRMAIKDGYGDTIFLDYNDVHIQNYFEGIVDGVVRPYLRPMSSMTVEEEYEYHQYKNNDYLKIFNQEHHEIIKTTALIFLKAINWLLKNHFDFMGLIPKNLAIEVTEDNNPYEMS